MYDYPRLMEETRRLAARYRVTTGQTLPVAAELARFDCMRLLDAKALLVPIHGVDVQSSNDTNWQVKGRAIFNPKKSGYRIGPLSLDGEWEALIVVLYDAQYEPTQLIELSRPLITEILSQADQQKSAHPHEITIAKAKALGQTLWSLEDTHHNLITR